MSGNAKMSKDGEKVSGFLEKLSEIWHKLFKCIDGERMDISINALLDLAAMIYVMAKLDSDIEMGTKTFELKIETWREVLINKEGLPYVN